MSPKKRVPKVAVKYDEPKEPKFIKVHVREVVHKPKFIKVHLREVHKPDEPKFIKVAIREVCDEPKEPTPAYDVQVAYPSKDIESLLEDLRRFKTKYELLPQASEIIRAI